MANKQNTQTYVLYQGNQKVYIGTTDTTWNSREQKHRR